MKRQCLHPRRAKRQKEAQERNTRWAEKPLLQQLEELRARGHGTCQQARLISEWVES